MKMASIGRSMYLSSIAIKYTLSDIVVFDCIPFPIFTHTMGMTHVPDCYGLNYCNWTMCCLHGLRYCII